MVEEVVRDTLRFYATSGFSLPWVSYLAVVGSDAVGVCSFKSAPKNHRVEIAYFTFPQYEGKGFATEMVAALLRIANDFSPELLVSARTLKDRNASHRVLEKSGFVVSGVVTDPEDGEVVEWLYRRLGS